MARYQSPIDMHTEINTSSRGFTLLEMIVSLAIFSVVAVIAVGALVRVVGLNRRAQTMQTSMTDLSFVLESMSREMRMGSTFHCETNINPATWTFLGSNYNSLTTAPCTGISAGSLTSGTGAVVIFKSSRLDAANGFQPLLTMYAFKPISANVWEMGKAEQNSITDNFDLTNTISSLFAQDPNVTLKDFRLSVVVPGSSPVFSKVFVRLIGSAGVRDQEINNFDVETSVSQRISD